MSSTNITEMTGPRLVDKAEGEVAARNPGTQFHAGWIDEIRVNRTAVERRTATLRGRRTVKKQWQAAWLVKAITCMDLTTLAGDDTPGRVRRLCAKARQPIRPDLSAALGINGLAITTGAVCVYHEMVPTAVAALKGSGVPVAAVSTGFPAGLSPFETRLAEIRASVAAGCDGLAIETHQDPSHAMTDGAQSITPAVLAELMGSLARVAEAVDRTCLPLAAV